MKPLAATLTRRRSPSRLANSFFFFMQDFEGNRLLLERCEPDKLDKLFVPVFDVLPEHNATVYPFAFVRSPPPSPPALLGSSGPG